VCVRAVRVSSQRLEDEDTRFNVDDPRPLAVVDGDNDMASRVKKLRRTLARRRVEHSEQLAKRAAREAKLVKQDEIRKRKAELRQQRQRDAEQRERLRAEAEAEAEAEASSPQARVRTVRP
jgi:hypothetical protein